MPPIPKPRPVLTPTQETEFESLLSDPKFNQCLKRLTGWRSARSYNGQAHPYLDRDDLKQVALIAAYETFGKYHAKPSEDRRKLCINAMRWALLKEFRRAVLSGGGSDVMIESLDDPQNGYSGDADGVGDEKAETLMREVSALAGEPDPLTMLLMKERASMMVSK